MSVLMKNYLILLIYSLSLILLWGLCFLSYPEANQITCGIGLVLTFLSTYFIQKEFGFNLKIWEKLILLVFPIAYTIVFLTQDSKSTFLFSPLLIGLIFLVFNLFVFKDLRIFRNNVFFVLITLSYTTVFFTRWQYVNSGESEKRSLIINESNYQTQKEKKQEVPEASINISSFSFLDLKSDTVNILSDKPYIFIQTWNEKCQPCKLAIKELTPMLDTMKNQVDSYFIYENLKFDKNLFVNSSKKEDDLLNQNVLADYNLTFFNSMKMNSYPVFFIIDNKKGKIIYMTVGYGGKASREKWIEKLREISKM